MNRNSPILGFFIGAVFPLIGFIIVYFIFRNGSQSIESFVSNSCSNNKNLARLLTLSILANLAPFVYFNTKRLDYLSKGVFIATMIYVVFIILLMYVW